MKESEKENITQLEIKTKNEMKEREMDCKT